MNLRGLASRQTQKILRISESGEIYIDKKPVGRWHSIASDLLWMNVDFFLFLRFSNMAPVRRSKLHLQWEGLVGLT